MDNKSERNMPSAVLILHFITTQKVKKKKGKTIPDKT